VKKFDALARVRTQLKGAPFPRRLGLSLRSLERGKVVLRMPNRKEFAQYRGDTHGGALSALLDTAATFATNSLLAEDQDSVTIELKVNFIKPGAGRHLDAEAVVLHHGRTTSITKVEVRRADGALCAYATATNLVFRREP
jgi:uncharacterized protein (TIGR00369 family)